MGGAGAGMVGSLGSDMNEPRGLLSNGLGKVTRNKRYIIWFYLLNLALAGFGTVAFSQQAHNILDRSLVSDRLVRGFDLSVFLEMLARPEFGSAPAASRSAAHFAVLFFVATALFLPGVLLGYASTYRLPREDFFRACGRNLWRFIRLMIVAGIVMLVLAALLFLLNGAIVKHATESTNELLSFELQMLGLFLIFLVMTTLRIWFDLAETDVVLSDQRAVRKSIGLAFGHTFHSLIRLLASYVVVTIVAAVILLGGLWTWIRLVRPESVVGAFLVGQFTLLLLLIPRFWQRGIAVSYWQQKMLVPVAAPVAPPIAPEPAPVAAPEVPLPPTIPTATQEP
jgi:hypothetical protein